MRFDGSDKQNPKCYKIRFIAMIAVLLAVQRFQVGMTVSEAVDSIESYTPAAFTTGAAYIPNNASKAFTHAIADLSIMSSVIPDGTPRNDPMEEIHPILPSKPKYLLYFAQSGWANQQVCLRNAYFMAKLLDRILLLPPVLPHLSEPGSTIPQMVLTGDGSAFKRTHTSRATNPFFIYLKLLPDDRYLPMSHVIDVNFSLPGIQTLDVRVFHEGFYNGKNLTKATIETDYGFSHFNTLWLHNLSHLEGKTEDVQRLAYGHVRHLSLTYRNLPAALRPLSEDILIFLDSYMPAFHETILADVPAWRPRMASSIRQAVQSTIASWPPYAAIHLRTGDGKFHRRIEETIRQVFSGIAQVIMDWLGLDRPTEPHTIGLYVATDLQNFLQHGVFAIEVANLTETVYQQHQVHLVLLSLADTINSTKILGGMLYEDAFLDLQISICAPIGFQGTSGSSFSRSIATHRQSEEAC